MADLRCPECGGSLWVELAWEGMAYLQSQVVDGFYCDECDAEWDKQGVRRSADVEL